MNEIVAGCYQFEVSVANPDRNMARLGEALPGIADAGCQLLVLPEMWSCGFDYPRLGQMAGHTPMVLDSLAHWSRRYGLVIVGSLPELHGGEVFNTSYVVDATGRIAGAYRKIHLFSLTEEDRHFGRGSAPMVCETELGPLGLMICYDLRFPELARRLALDGARILCVSAQWPLVRKEHWTILSRSRAIENQLFLLGCNACGKDSKVTYAGGSIIASPLGEILAEGSSEDSFITARLHFDKMESFRNLIPCFNDRIPGVYGID
jgi:predicted amidohydrolase